MLTGMEHWELDDAEAKAVTSSASDVLSHYNVVVADKTADWLSLLTVFGTVYGARMILTAQELHKRQGGQIQPAPFAEAAPQPVVDPGSLNGAAAPAASIGVGHTVEGSRDELIPPMFRAPKQ